MKIYLCLASILLSACSAFSEDEAVKNISSNGISAVNEVTNIESNQDGYFKKALKTDVNDYAKWLMQDLISNLDLPSNDDVFIVTDIALLDSDLNKTNHFGRQLTEALIHEVNRAGFSVIDVKNRGFIRFNEDGDVFYQTRDFLEVAPNVDVSNVLTGTMTRHRGGYLINAKIIDINTNALISSGQILVPHDVVDSVMKEAVPPTVEKIVVEKKPSLKLKAYKTNE